MKANRPQSLHYMYVVSDETQNSYGKSCDAAETADDRQYVERLVYPPFAKERKNNYSLVILGI